MAAAAEEAPPEEATEKKKKKASAPTGQVIFEFVPVRAMYYSRGQYSFVSFMGDDEDDEHKR